MVLSKLAPGCYACKYVFDAQTNQSLAKHFGMNWAVHRMYYLVDLLDGGQVVQASARSSVGD
jgi:hypothetical protein